MATVGIGNLLCYVSENLYDPSKDDPIPFNKAFGSEELNKIIAITCT